MSAFSNFIERIKKFFRLGRKEIEVISPPVEIKEEPIIPSIEEKPIIEEPEYEIPEAKIPPEEKEILEEELAKLVTFEERIRGTRIKRVMIRVFPLEMSDGEISRQLDSQYDSGGNYVINIKSIEVSKSLEYEEEELERGLPGSADESP